MPTFRRLLGLMRPFTGWMALATLLGFATIGSSVGLLATSAYLISAAALQPSIAVLQIPVVGVRFFGLSRGVFRYLERYVSHQVTFRLLARLRVWFYTALDPLAPARLQAYRSGDLLSRIVADIESLEHFYLRVLAPPLVAGLIFLLTGLLLASFDGWLAVVGLLFLLLAGVGLPLLTHRLSRGWGRQLITDRADLNVLLLDTVQGCAEWLLAGQARSQQARVGQLSRRLTQAQERLAWVTGLHGAGSGLLANWATLSILLVAIPLVSQGRLEGVYLAVLVLAVSASFEAVIPLPEALQHLESSLAAARRLFDLLDAPPAVPASAGPSLTPAHFGLTVKNLSFRYQEDEAEVLQNLSFALAPGRRVALVGPSGAGKSTLLNLLLRFWDYQNGSIELGGHDLRRYRPDDVRQLISVVSSSPTCLTAPFGITCCWPVPRPRQRS
jgi:thiol reductant ABC exporter CydC subunit